MPRDRSNIKAGLFVVAGITLAFVVLVMLTDFTAWFTPMKRIEVRFALGDGVAGLKPGAVVAIGDHSIGNVTNIQPARNEDGRVTGLLVTAEIPDEYVLYENAQIKLDVPPLGAGSRLDIVSVGTPEPPQTADAPGADWRYNAEEDPPLEGGISPSQFASDFAEEAGIGAKQRLQVQAIIQNVEHLTEAIAGDMPEDQLTDRAKRVNQTLADFRDTAARVNALTEALAGDKPADQLPERAAEIAAAVRQLEPMLREARGTLAEARQTLEENRAKIRQTVDTVARLVERNAPILDQTLEAGRETFANAEQISDSIRNQTLDQLHGVLGKADQAMGSVKTSVAEVEEMVVTQRPVMEKMIANLRLASDQFKLAAIEIRRAPWRLLYEPKEKELETENLYDAARSFAVAASNLEATASSMEAMLNKYGETIDPGDSRLKLMLQNMQRTFERFSEVQNKFWRALEERGGERQGR